MEKITKYQELKREIIRMWAFKKVSCTSSCWCIGDCIKKTKGIFGKDWYVNNHENITKNYLTVLGTARKIRNVLDMNEA